MFKRLNTTSILIILFIIVLVALGVKIIQKDTSAKKPETEEKVSKVSFINVDEFKKDNSKILSIGQVEALNQVQLKSQLAGEIKRINVKIGDEVKKGDLLVEIDHSSLDAQLAQSSAMIERIRAGFDLRVAGATIEQIEQAQKAVEQAEAGVVQAQAGLEQVKTGNESLLKNSKIALEMARSNLVNTGASSGLAKGNASENLKITVESGLSIVYGALTSMGNIFGVSPGEPTSDDLFKDVLGVKNINQKNKSKSEFNIAKSNYESFNNLEISVSNIEDLSLGAQNILDSTKIALESTRKTLDNTVTTYIFNNSVLNGLKSGIDLQISYINAAKGSLQGALQALEGSYLADISTIDANELGYRQAQENLVHAEAQVKANLESAEAVLSVQMAGLAQVRATYNLLVADPREVDLSGLKASVKEAQASYGLLSTNRDKAFIRAPFNGKISAVPMRIYDLVNPGQTVVSMVNTGGLQVKTYVNEKERMSIVQLAEVLIEDEVKGVVTNIAPSIDPLTKKVEVLIVVNQEDAVLTIGQYVDVKIFAVRANQDIYYLPLKSIRNTTESAYVFIVNDEDVIEEKEIKLGRIIDVSVEVLDGLEEGMEIVESVRGLDKGERINF